MLCRGAPNGATIAMLGSATRGSEHIEFQINDATEYAFSCGEYVGDGRKGILQPTGQAELEATLHFDHLFGDAETPAEDALNVNAAGFDQFAALAVDGQLEVWVSDLDGSWPAEDVTRFRDALASLGHVGEGHCYESGGGYTGESNGR